MGTTADIINYQDLRKLLLLQNIPPASLKKLAAENPCKQINAGRIIFSRGQTDNAVVYLIKGKVALSDHEHEEIVTADSSAARIPLDNHQPRQCTAKAITDVTIFELNHNLLDIITTNDSTINAINVSEIHEDDSHVDNQLMYKLYQEYMNGELKLACLPELAIWVRKAIQN